MTQNPYPMRRIKKPRLLPCTIYSIVRCQVLGVVGRVTRLISHPTAPFPRLAIPRIVKDAREGYVLAQELQVRGSCRKGCFGSDERERRAGYAQGVVMWVVMYLEIKFRIAIGFRRREYIPYTIVNRQIASSAMTSRTPFFITVSSACIRARSLK